VNIARILHRQCSERGHSAAIIDRHRGRDRVLSFQDLEAASVSYRERIARRGVGPGDAVLILHPMSAELYAFLVALFRMGAVAMFLDPSAGRGFVERCLRICPPRAFFGTRKAQLVRLLIPALGRVPLAISSEFLPGTTYLPLELRSGPEEPDAIFPAGTSDPALITFTSGSSGEPKAALRTHGFLAAQHRALAESLGHQAGTVDLTTLPVFVLANLASGITSVLPDADMRRPGHIRATPVLGQFERLPITTMAASPAFVARLGAECRKRGLRFPQMTEVFMGGAPVFPEDLDQAREVFPRAGISAVYGSTEAEPMAEISRAAIGEEDRTAMQHGRGLLAGPPVGSIELRIVQSQWGTPMPAMDRCTFDALVLEPGEVGEIVVSGAHVLPGYLHGAGDAKTKFRVEGGLWHRTGDLGWLDPGGRLWLMGAASAAISDERGVLYPFAVECAAREVPGVRRAAVVVLDRSRILAVETGRGEKVEATAILQALGWARLDGVRLLPAIPMDKRHNAKIDHAALRRMLAGNRNAR
jgi:olefin beta-lactone synthetase